jgi:uncharacterized protein YecE (DUF72 family)
MNRAVRDRLAIKGQLRQALEAGVSPYFQPRYASSLTVDGDDCLARYEASRVAADPLPVNGADVPGAWPHRIYFWLHGGPERFYSAYSDVDLTRMCERLLEYAQGGAVWCISNNTATAAARINALDLTAQLDHR